MEYFNEVLKLGQAEWFVTLNGTQKTIFLVLIFLLLMQLINNLLHLWASRRVKKMPPSDEEKATITDCGEAVHEVLFNALYLQKITPKFYKKMCRELEPLLPGLVGNIYTEKSQELMKKMRKKISIANRIKYGVYLPTLGWRIYWRRLEDMLQPKKISKFNRQK